MREDIYRCLDRLRAVFVRELGIIWNNPVYLLASAGVMVFCQVFFLTFFSDGLPSDLPVGMVDMDNSSLSREFARQLDATQLGRVVGFGDWTQARQALQTGKVNAVCVIPAGMYEDVLAGRQPVVSFYVNSLYFVGGALAYKDVLTMINLSSGAVSREMMRAKGMGDDAVMTKIQPVVIDTHQIGNPETDYGIYLVNVLLPGILEMSVIMVTVYAVGTEIRYRRTGSLLDVSGGSAAVALAGKLLPYTLLFILIGIMTDILLYVVMRYPLAVPLWRMVAGTVMLVLASQSAAVFVIGMLPSLRDAVSAAAVYSVLALSMAGFTFPVEAMPPYVGGLSVLFPLRHYYLYYVSEVIYASPGIRHLVAMGAFLVLPLTVYVRLRRVLHENS